MATATREAGQPFTAAGPAASAWRYAAHLSQDARARVSAAGEALEVGVHGATRAIKSVRRRVEDLGDLKDEAARCVKRHPVAAVGAAFGAGLAIGLAAARLRRRRAADTQNSSALLEAVL